MLEMFWFLGGDPWKGVVVPGGDPWKGVLVLAILLCGSACPGGCAGNIPLSLLSFLSLLSLSSFLSISFFLSLSFSLYLFLSLPLFFSLSLSFSSSHIIFYYPFFPLHLFPSLSFHPLWLLKTHVYSVAVF